jgi:cellulose biosynthesis protein BcsQ
MNRITIFVGEFGSGKTELAMNYALYLRDYGLKTAIVDIDLVKPYFRARENSEMLERNGIKVVAPEKRLAHAGLPVLPHELSSILSDDTYHVVMDVGGGEAAIVLGQFRQEIQQLSPDILMVVNTRRPFTSNVEGIITTMRRIERVSGLMITGLVSNTNIGSETTENHVKQGYHLVCEVGRQLTLPVKFFVLPYWLEDKFKLEKPSFILRPYTQYPWMG